MTAAERAVEEARAKVWTWLPNVKGDLDRIIAAVEWRTLERVYPVADYSAPILIELIREMRDAARRRCEGG